MAKTAALSIRVLDATKTALEKAAEDDGRSVASLADRILTEWLRERNYLEAPKKK